MFPPLMLTSTVSALDDPLTVTTPVFVSMLVDSKRRGSSGWNQDQSDMMHSFARG